MGVFSFSDPKFTSSQLPESVFQQAIEHAAGGLLICDVQQPSWPIVYASPGFERLTGYKAEDVLGKSCQFLQGEETEQIGLQEIREALHGLSDRTAARLRNKALLAGVIQVKIRQSDFRTFTRQCRVKPATANTQQIYHAAARLVDEWRAEHPEQRIRLLGVGGASLLADQQLDMFSEEPRLDGGHVDKTVDAVRERFSELGNNALQSARTLQREDD